MLSKWNHSKNFHSESLFDEFLVFHFAILYTGADGPSETSENTLGSCLGNEMKIFSG